MSIGESLLSNVLPLLFEKLASPVISELSKLHGVKDEIAKLRRTVERLQAMLHDAEQKKLAEGRQGTLWLQEIQRALYAAEDLVDEFEYEGLRRKVMKSSTEGRHGADGSYLESFMSGKLSKLCSCLTPQAVSFRHQMARKIDDLRRKLDEISKEKKDFKLGGALGFKANLPEFDRPAETTALLGTPEVFGRDEVKNKLVELLLTTTADAGSTPSSSSSSSSLPVHPTNFSVISIVGMGGLGKTTLAQLVYNTEQVLDHFPIRIWVCVSLDFDLKKLTKQILEHLVDTQSNIPSRDNLNVLQQDLSKTLKGKRFLLVLDDVWEVDQNKWKAFSAPLAHGGRGSQVLITTRNANVANILKPKKIELQVLSPPDSWSIFKTYAFTHAHHSGKFQILEPIGREIVNKLKGVPLALSVIGGLLGSELDERKWRAVLDSKLWELEQGGHGILPALKLSYEFLPYHLKKCFTYCCVWPKAASFDILELVPLWMAQGYVQPQGNKSMPDVGLDYINDLLNRSLIQVVYGRFMIHDLLHDLGQQILEQEYYRIGPDQVQETPEDAHSKIHLVASYSKAPENMRKVLYEFKSLRSLSLFWPSTFPYKLPIDLFHMVKGLRVFIICDSGIDVLPDSISYLKHLRYLDLRSTNIKCLPETLCSLYNLQTLKLEGCDKLKVLPSGMSSLVNLHHLDARTELVSKIAQIGKLVHLQYLDVFSISEENKNRLGDLKNMRELRGRLWVQNLERVTTRIEDTEANILKNMQYLESIKLQWTNSGNVNQIMSNYPVESIMQCLQPPQHLKELIVESYAGTNFPSWMDNASIPGLEHLYLHNCTNLNPFSPLGELHCLRTLHITGCPQLKELSQLPPTLENLVLERVGLVVPLCRLHQLPLQHLILGQIPTLKQLPILPFTLRELAIEGVGLEALPELCQSYERSTTTTTTMRGPNTAEDYKSCNYFGEPVLSFLKIHACPHLTTLDGGMLKQHHLRHLRVLSIKGCEELVDWPQGEVFQATLYSLADELSIEACPKLPALPEGSRLHPSLKKLVVKGSDMVPNRLMLGQVHNIVDDVDVHVNYPNLEQCANEALQHISAVERLEIVYIPREDDHGLGAPFADGAESPIVFLYNRISDWDYRVMYQYIARRVQLHILGRGGGGRRQAAADGVVSTEVLQRCLGGHPWTSSLRHLGLIDIPGEELIISGGVPDSDHHQLLPPLPSLQELWFEGCMEMRSLPMEKMLSHLTALTVLTIVNCPELTWSSVDVGIRSLPSLQTLMIGRCPKLLQFMPPQPSSSSSSFPKSLISKNSTVDGDKDDTGSSPAAVGLPQLQYLRIDDLRLLTQRLLVDHDVPHDGLRHVSTGGGGSGDQSVGTSGQSFPDTLLTSLRLLRLDDSELTSLTPVEERVLRTLAPSLRCLVFQRCPHLENLPTELRGLLPNLKILVINQCPKLRRLPALPAALEVLAINECPEMEKELADARHNLDLLRIPVWLIDGMQMTGSYSKFQELRAKWDFRAPIED